MYPFSAAADYLSQKNLELQFRKLIGQVRARQGAKPEALNPPLSQSEREIMDRAIASGLPAQLKPGVVDTLVASPELAYALIEQGAVPTDDLLENLRTIISGVFLRMVKIEGMAKQDPKSSAAWLERLVEKVADKHPGLDWFGLDPKNPRDAKFLFSFKHRGHFPKLPGIVQAARARQNIPWDLAGSTNERLMNFWMMR
jgi:hypothetical protein